MTQYFEAVHLRQHDIKYRKIVRSRGRGGKSAFAVVNALRVKPLDGKILRNKLAELFISRRLEVELTKGRILELYLNLIEWGDGIWGAEAASRAYFGVPASALTPEQSALLAGAIINPRIYRPSHPNARLRSRQQIILVRMGFQTPPAAPEPVPTLDIPIGVGLPPVVGGSGSE